jgi:hypothetical protein
MEKLVKIQSELKAPKSLFNKFGGYSYRSAETILEAVKPLLTKYNMMLIITDDVVNLEDRFYIKATATVTDIKSGISISSAALAREPFNKKGSDESQITGAASSYARKYALNGLFAIDDGVDADSQNKHESEPPKKQSPAKKKDLTMKQYESGLKAIEKASMPELSKFEGNLDRYDENGANVKKMRKVIENKFKAMKDGNKDS